MKSFVLQILLFSVSSYHTCLQQEIKEDKTMKREQLGSRMGFIMLSAGCAIGCGNVWKFPWMCGQNGGGSFMLVYIICLLILGIPALTMEFSVGRAAQSSPLYMYQQTAKARPEMGHLWLDLPCR